MFDDHDEPSRLDGERLPNPFTPVSYDERLRAPLKKAERGAVDMPMHPGQFYTGSYDKWMSRPAPLSPLGRDRYSPPTTDRYEPTRQLEPPRQAAFQRQAEPLRFHEPMPKQETEPDYGAHEPIKPNIPGYLQKARQLTPLKSDKQARDSYVAASAYAAPSDFALPVDFAPQQFTNFTQAQAPYYTPKNERGIGGEDSGGMARQAETQLYEAPPLVTQPFELRLPEAQAAEAQPFAIQPADARQAETQLYEAPPLVTQPFEPQLPEAQAAEAQPFAAPAKTNGGAARRSRSQRKEQPARKRRADRRESSNDAGESAKALEYISDKPQALDDSLSSELGPWDYAPQQSNITAFPTQADMPAQAYEPQANELAGFDPSGVEAYSSGHIVEAELTEPMDEIASFFSDYAPEDASSRDAGYGADYTQGYAPDQSSNYSSEYIPAPAPEPETAQDYPTDRTSGYAPDYSPAPFAAPVPEPFEPQAANPSPDAPKLTSEQIKRAEIAPVHKDYSKPDDKRRIRPWRLAALISIVGMIAFVLIAGGGILSDLARNKQEMSDFRAAYREQNGVSPEQDGHMVSLLPYGQTFAPAATPVPAVEPGGDSTAAQSPDGIEAHSPDNASAQGGSPADKSTSSPEAAEPAAAGPARTRLKAYPHNPLMNKLSSITDLQSENADIVGRLVISGVLDEVVVQRNNTYYLTHSYRGSASASGAVFIDEGCSLKSPPENLLLRGQDSEDGKAFAPLWQFSTGGSAFVSTATRATLTTLYEEAEYVLFAVISTSSQAASGFNYAGYPSFASDEEMLAHVNKAISQSLYKFKVSVEASDRLLTLATIGREDKTLVLMYRMVRDDER